MLEEELIRKAAFNLTRTDGWNNVTFEKISKVTNLDTDEIKKFYGSKIDIVKSLIREVTKDSLNSIELDLNNSPRDHLFDLLMAHFDRLMPYKDILGPIISAEVVKPCEMKDLFLEVVSSMRLLLKATNISTSGISGKLRIKGLFIIYINSFRVWLKDSSSDLAKTMATLDHGLIQAEKFSKFLWSFSTSARKFSQD